MKDHISVCVPTHHRNQMIERLLRNLALQETGGLFDFSVVVVDNDATGTARETVMWLKKTRARVRSLNYHIEINFSGNGLKSFPLRGHFSKYLTH